MSAEGGVKSARRVLEILELFSGTHQPASVTQIAQRLDYPQSSTSMLLAEMESLGYLQYDREARTYRPTLRVMLLGSWMQDELFGKGSLVSAMEMLRRRTGQAVMIGMRQGVQVRFILSLNSTLPGALRFSAGKLSPVLRSAVGKCLLAAESNGDIERIARRANAEATEEDHKVPVARLMDEIRKIRAQGWAETLDYPVIGRGTIAMRLPPLPGQPALGLTLGARKAKIERDRPAFIRALREAYEGLQKSAENE